MYVGLISQVTSDRTQGSGPNLHHRWFRLVIRKNLFVERVVKNWNRQSREVVVAAFLEICKGYVNMALREMM